MIFKGDSSDCLWPRSRLRIESGSKDCGASRPCGTLGYDNYEWPGHKHGATYEEELAPVCAQIAFLRLRLNTLHRSLFHVDDVQIVCIGAVNVQLDWRRSHRGKVRVDCTEEETRR